MDGIRLVGKHRKGCDGEFVLGWTPVARATRGGAIFPTGSHYWLRIWCSRRGCPAELRVRSDKVAELALGALK